MNAFLKAALWIAVYAVLGAVLWDGVRLLIRAKTARIIRVRLGKRAAADIVGAAASAGCAAFAFVQSAISGVASAIAGIGEYFALISDEYEELSAFADMFPRDGAYYSAVYKCAGAFAVVLAVYFLLSCFASLYYVTERGLLRRGMISPERLTAELRGGKIAVFFAACADREKPTMTFKDNPKNRAALERFLTEESRLYKVSR